MLEDRKQIRAIVLGAGAAGHLHAIVYKSLGVKLLGVFDPDPLRRKVFAQTHDCHEAFSQEELFELNADLISITSPPIHHFDQTIMALDRSIVPLVEKPVITSLGNLEIASTFLNAVPIVQWRYGAAFQQLSAVYKAGLLGKSPSIVGDLNWHRDADYFSAGRSERSGWGAGAFLSIGIHLVDLICALLGPPVDSCGFLRHDEGSDLEISAVASFKFKANALATARVTFEGSRDATTVVVSGNGVTGRLVGGGSDPTTLDFIWSTSDPILGKEIQRLCDSLETNSSMPLLKPLVGAVIKALLSEEDFASCGVATIPDVLISHKAILEIYKKQSN